MDFSTIGGVLQLFYETVGQVLRAEWQAVAEVQLVSQGVIISIIIILVAGFSEAVGQSIVLFANEVKPWYFISSILVSAVIFLFGFAFWALSIWTISYILYGTRVSLETVVVALGLAYTPLLFTFLVLLPYLGTIINRTLYVWSLIATLYIVGFALDLGLLQMFICALLGLIVIQTLRATIGRPVSWLSLRMRNLAAGTALDLDLSNVLARRKDNRR